MHSPVLKYNIDEYTDSSNPFFLLLIYEIKQFSY